MKSITNKLLVLICLLSILTIGKNQAQTTITDASIPQIGDSINNITDNLPNGIMITAPGPNQTWDFTSLQGPFAQVQIYEADSSDDFPNANARITSGITNTWYDLTSDAVFIEGFSSPDPFGIIPGQVNTQLDPPLSRIEIPMEFSDQLTQSSSILINIDPSQLPDTLFSGIGFTPDSIRLRVSFDENLSVDAWGTTLLNNESFDVLRRRVERVTNASVEALLPFLGWRDVTDFVIDFIPSNFLNDTSRSYEFWADGEIEPVVTLNVSTSDSVEQALFKADIFSSVKDAKKQPFGVYVYPNPSFGSVRFEFLNIESGMYQLKVMNILGQEMWSQRSYIENTDVIYTDLSELKRGTYFYALSNSSGKRIVTRRLIIIKP